MMGNTKQHDFVMRISEFVQHDWGHDIERIETIHHPIRVMGETMRMWSGKNLYYITTDTRERERDAAWVIPLDELIQVTYTVEARYRRSLEGLRVDLLREQANWPMLNWIDDMIYSIDVTLGKYDGDTDPR